MREQTSQLGMLRAAREKPLIMLGRAFCIFRTDLRGILKTTSSSSKSDTATTVVSARCSAHWLCIIAVTDSFALPLETTNLRINKGWQVIISKKGDIPTPRPRDRGPSERKSTSCALGLIFTPTSESHERKAAVLVSKSSISILE